MQTPIRPPARNNWADELLGFSIPTAPFHEQSLEAEVDAYLLDPQVGLSSLSYWQVITLGSP